MAEPAVRVALHCHSNLSDGSLTPEALARSLAAQGARYAALTDHDTVRGLRPFRQTLARAGVGAIDGVEIAAMSGRSQVHLVAYGVDPRDAGLEALLAATRRGPSPGAEAIRVLHASGGLAFLAHPLSQGWSASEVEDVVRDLGVAGLDGIETLYAGYSAEQVTFLEGVAGRNGLAGIAGSDYHGPGSAGGLPAVQEIPRAQWEAFRERLFAAAAARPRGSRAAPAVTVGSETRLRKGRFAARIVLPTAIAIVLFLSAIFGIVIPEFERSLLDRKKEMIQELTTTAVSILREYAADEAAGLLSREAAQAAAATRVRDLRYGNEGKDYFWITDMRPVMIMHPWRTELEGTDVTGYTDSNGIRVFVEFVNAVRDREEGYVEYLWQWKDDAHRIVPKLSFIRRFAPWDWVVGTGVYIEDVNAEIAGIAGRIVGLSTLIATMIALLLLFVVHQSLAVERARRRAESGLRESHERYRALVEASTEGMLVVLDGACTYANRTFQDMVGFTAEELSLLETAELVRAEDEVCRFLGALSGERGTPEAGSCECLVMGRSGRLVDALLTASRFDLGGREGAIVTVKDLAARRRALESGEPPLPAGLWRETAVGLLRATTGRRAIVLEANPAARSLLGLSPDGELPQTNLSACFSDARDAESLRAALASHAAVRGREVVLRAADGEERFVRLSAVVDRVDGGEARAFSVLLEDLTELRRELDRGQTIRDELETFAFRLGVSVSVLASPALLCGMETPVAEAVRRMGHDGADALVVTTADGHAVGMVTDRDIRDRVVGAGIDYARPAREIMSSPVRRLPADATLWEAIVAMRERGLGHLVIEDTVGRITGTLSIRGLLRHYGSSPAVLAREIQLAASRETLAECRRRLVELTRDMAVTGGPQGVNRTFTHLSDVVVRRLVELAVQELGRPPAPFAFVALGSEGRQEQVPGSDQDNAIVWHVPAGAGTGSPEIAPREPECTAYFSALGRRVCADLEAVGVPSCAGGAMASNPRWCVPLESWEAYFRTWVLEPEPSEVLDFSIFFDFRCVAGDELLVSRLGSTVRKLVAANPAFLHHLARNLVQRRQAAPRAPVVDVKQTMAYYVGFARLYALRDGVAATNTQGRLDALRANGTLSATSYQTIRQAWTLLLRLRRAKAGTPVMDPSSLDGEAEAGLRAAVAHIGPLQQRLSFEYPGAAV
jgi:PAS domain S-box-containing protein